MSNFESLSHSRWDCKYHVVFIPKHRKKERYGKIRKFLGPLFHEWAQQKGCTIVEGHMRSCSHAHQDTAEACGLVHHRVYQGQERYRSSPSILWSKAELQWRVVLGYYAVSTVGIEEAQVRKYIREQEELEGRREQGLF